MSADTDHGESAPTASHPERPRLKRPCVFVVLPAFNEEENIARLLDKIDESMADSALQYRVVVVDDGSRDRTYEILTKYLASIPLTILRHEVNQGLGATIRDGLCRASELASEHDIVITMDADETHTPGLILRMVRMIREGHDVVIASRYQAGARVYGVSFPRRVLSAAASWTFRIVFPTQGVRDFTCGYRAYRAATLKAALSKYGDDLVATSGFQCMVDILLKLRSMDLIFGEAPLILRYDLKRGASKMRVAKTIRQTLSLAIRRRLGFQ